MMFCLLMPTISNRDCPGNQGILPHKKIKKKDFKKIIEQYSLEINEVGN